MRKACALRYADHRVGENVLDIDVGQVIAGKYELVRLIGKGAMGEVWAATHNSLGGEFAIKLVRPSDDIEDETAAGRFQLEAQVSAKLSRKTRHIVSVSDHGEENGLAYLVMELLDGESLEARLKNKGEMTVAETVAMVMQVARALGIAHAEGIFHRDLKPANVFFTRDEDGKLLVKLLDFGIARTEKPMRTKSPFATGKDMVLGTPSYMSPEQARGLAALDYRCDLWALAVVAYEALTRRIPWEGTTVEDIFLSICTHRVVPIMTVRDTLPPETEGVFAKAFAPKLDDRYALASEMSEAFETLTTPEDIEDAAGGSMGLLSARNVPAARSSQKSFSEITAPQIPAAPASDPNGVAVAEPNASSKTKKQSSWMWAAAAGASTLLLILLGLLAFGPKKQPAQLSTTESPPDPPPALSSATPPNPTMGTTVSPTPSMIAVTAPDPPTPPTASAPSAKRVGKGAPKGAPMSHASTHATAPATTAAPTPPTPPPAPTPKKPGDKGEVL